MATEPPTAQSLAALLKERDEQLRRQAEELRVLSLELLQVEQCERARLAGLLHDDLQQLLVAAQMRLHQVDEHTSGPAAAEAAKQARELVQQAINASRSLAVDLSPPILAAGLTPALRALAQEFGQRHGLKVVIRYHSRPGEIPAELRGLLFRAVRELLFNVVKHARVNRARVEVDGGDGHLVITVKDHGQGYNLAQQARARSASDSGFGLNTLRHRFESLGGSLRLDSHPGQGCQVTLTLPMPSAQPG